MYRVCISIISPTATQFVHFSININLTFSPTCFSKKYKNIMDFNFVGDIHC